MTKADLAKNAQNLIKTLADFGVEAEIVNIQQGPAVTRYEIRPQIGVKISKILGLSEDIALRMAAKGIRIAPIPGKTVIGVEVANQKVMPVFVRDVIDSPEFRGHPSKVSFALGKDIAGTTVVGDIAKMPHCLIAGSTGSGKSVCVNSLIASILYKSGPDEVKLIMIDPKVVELSVYNGIPHLLIPVVTDPRKAAGALNWAVMEMLNRYNLFARANVRDLESYNEFLRANDEEALPKIVIIVDELADLMIASPKEVEEYICRLAQLARAAGMHLIIATQRP
jgi:S-DNA-T family DNA segregation ATPase FtsK/SpoIIIE